MASKVVGIDGNEIPQQKPLSTVENLTLYKVRITTITNQRLQTIERLLELATKHEEVCEALDLFNLLNTQPQMQ